jgi:hypothetical protein
MTLATRALPRPAGVAGDEAWPGLDSRPASLPKFATALGDRAAVRNNELLATR